MRQFPFKIQTLGIPTFRNQTSQYRVEQVLTAAVLKEFSERTRQPVHSTASAVDAVLLGEIRSVSSTPVAFGTDSFGSTFLVTVQLSVKLQRLSDNATLWESPDFLFRERYVLNYKATDFFSEEGAALERLAREFAASLAGMVLRQ